MIVMKKIAYCFLLILAACGGGDGDGFGGGDGWQTGVFLDASSFAAHCAAPRNSINPATGQPFPDIQGITADENNFLRSYSNDTYLWYDEIDDRDPGAYSDPLEYFDLLRTFELTPSGAPKDKVEVAGNLKYAIRPLSSPIVPRLRAMAEEAGAGPILVAGSTMPGEEKFLAAAIRDPGQEFPRLLMILAPRHPERFTSVDEELRAAGIRL